MNNREYAGDFWDHFSETSSRISETFLRPCSRKLDFWKTLKNFEKFYLNVINSEITRRFKKKYEKFVF